MLDGLRILLVDDDFDTCQLVTLFLEMQGSSVKAVNSASEGFEAFLQWQPDLLISDIAMPDEDGLSMIRRIRTAETQLSKVMPVIVVTAYTLTDDEQNISSDFQACLTKPVNFEQLVETISSLAKGIQRETECQDKVA